MAVQYGVWQAITWDSGTGRTVLYDNGRPVWRVYRSKGKTIPSGGTLVIGREQVCVRGERDKVANGGGRTS